MHEKCSANFATCKHLGSGWWGTYADWQQWFRQNHIPAHVSRILFSKTSAGEILWNGHDITQSGVFHQYKLQLNWLSLKDTVKEKFTVLNNVQWLEVLEGNQGNSLPALELMRLGRLAKEKARMLSMGQRKRLQLARSLAVDRPIWLLDEPSVALEAEGERLLEYIIAEHRKNGGIVIVAARLLIQIKDAMNLRLPPRFPARMTWCIC